MKKKELEKLKLLILLLVEQKLNNGPSNRHDWEIEKDLDELELDIIN